MAEPSPAVQCPKCRHASTEPLNFCPKCGADLRGIGGFTDTFAGTLAGKVIADRYRIIERLGEGGMGAVYKVQHTRMGKVMALKLLRPELSQRTEALERFRQEAEVVARLSSPHTISIFDFGETDEGTLYIAMEYLPGSDLAHVLRLEGRLPEARVAEIGTQACRSLAEAHDNGIIHRDIKPANVMLLRTREKQDLVKVLDFGIAKLRARRGTDSPITGAGDFVGTPEYLSPEQARGEGLTPASDIYALGAMLYELACGVPVFDGATPLAIVSRHLTEEPAPPRRRVPGLPLSPAFEALLLKTLAKQPECRFASADELRAALEPLAGLRAVPEFSQTPRDTGDLSIASREDWARFERRLRRGIWTRNVAALLVTAGVLAGGAWYTRRLLSAPPAPLTQEVEPNDRASQANLIGSGLPIRGHLGARFSDLSSDKDFFRIEITGTDEVLRAEATGVPGMSLVLDLYGPGSPAPLTRADGPPGGGVVIPDWPVEEGTYYLELRAKTAPGQVPPENVSDWYTLTATATPRLPGEEKRPNFTPETASAAAFEQPALGYPAQAGGTAFFALDPLSARAELMGVKLAAVLTPVAGADLRLVLGNEELPAGRAGFLPELSGVSRRIVGVKTVGGGIARDPFVIAFFTPRGDGGHALVSAVRRLVAAGRSSDAAALAAGAEKLVPGAPWAPAVQAALRGSDAPPGAARTSSRVVEPTR